MPTPHSPHLQLAEQAGIGLRYAREWLEQQAVAGLITVDEAARPADERRYSLPPEHANVLVAEDHPAHLAPLAQMVAGIGGALERVIEAYRTGGGVAYPHFGAAFRRGQAGINRPAFVTDLVRRWIPAAPDIHRALTTSRIRVADVGCGAGWSTIAMARTFPQAEVVGFDADEASVVDARALAAANGVTVRFERRDAISVGDQGPFDLVLVLEALHDMSRPREVLAVLRETLAPGGSVLVADEKVGEHFHAPADDLERLMYGWSIVHCSPRFAGRAAISGYWHRHSRGDGSVAGCVGRIQTSGRAARRRRILSAVSPARLITGRHAVGRAYGPRGAIMEKFVTLVDGRSDGLRGTRRTGRHAGDLPPRGH